MFHLLYYLVYWDAVHEKFIFHVASNIQRLYHLESIYSNTPGAVFSFQTVLQLSLAITMNHNFWTVEKPVYLFPSKLHTFWKMIEILITPSAILLEFLYQFEQYFFLYFTIFFYVCKMTENLIIPSAILLKFLYQFEQYFCFYFVIFYVCFINVNKEKRTRHSQHQKPNFCYPKHIYCFVFCLVSLFFKQFLISVFPEETTSLEMRDFILQCT